MTHKRKILGSMSLMKKTIFLYITMAILPILIITVTASLIYTRYFLEQSYSFVEESAKNQEEVVKERLEEYKTILYKIAADKTFIKYAGQMDNSTQKDWLIPREKMEGIFEDNIYTYDKVRTFSFFAENNFYANYSRWHQSSRDVIWVNQKDRNEIYDKISSDRYLTYLPTLNVCNNTGIEDYVFLIGCPVKDLRTKHQYGVLVMALNSDILLFESENTGDLTSTVVVDKDDTILAGKDRDYVMKNLDEYVSARYQERGIYTRKYEIEDLGWSIVNILDMHVLYRQIAKFVVTVFVLMVVITLLFFSIVYGISKEYVDDINRIVNGITSFEQDSNQTIDVRLNNNDELYVIAERFNSMTARVQALMNALKRKNEEIRIAAENQKHAEIVALEAQINPHFLYNTLDSIIWMIRSEEYDGAGEMVSLLAKFFRTSLSQGKDMIPLEKELEHATSYLAIQNIRFKDKFEFHVDADQELLKYFCPKLSIQPLLENAIYHGMEGMYEDGEIEIRVYEKDGDIKIDVSDNGPGMTQEKIDYIMHNKVVSSRRGSGIGVCNVNERIQLIYGKNYGITLSSELDEGTIATITIPKMEEIDEQ